MRHRFKGRKLGRNASHRKAMFRNMACSLIRSVRVDEDTKHKPAVPGRVITTVAKAKELRPFVEKLITIARMATEHEARAAEFATSAPRNSDDWKRWRQSQQWNDWNQAIAPAVAYRRRAFAKLRDKLAVSILFDELAERFQDRDGGYTRVVQLAEFRLGDAGRKALIEFVGERDREKKKRRAPLLTDVDSSSTPKSHDAESHGTASSGASVASEATATDGPKPDGAN